jgi:aspartokinase
VEVRPDRVRVALAAGEVAIVAGFQGVSRSREVTTLGRGGSDTTAVVLAAALGADECEICSDVDGVWSADPRSVPTAVKLDAMSLAEALAMSGNGAKVLYADAVAWAQRHGVTLRASATLGTGTGTVVSAAPVPPRMIGITSDTQLAEGDLSVLARLPTPCVRRATPRGVLVDLRNLHDAVSGLTPAATVAVVGSRCGSTPDLLRAILAVGSGEWHASEDAVVFRVSPADAAALERRLHDALVTPGAIRTGSGDD